MLFDLNDFDETLPGPFEYDVKRMAASFTIAARNNGFTKAEAHDVTLASVRAYREAMAEFAQMRTMDIWYAHLSEQELMAALNTAVGTQKDKVQKKEAKEGEKAAKKGALKARTRDSLQALSKLAEHVDGNYRIVSQPPIVIPARELTASIGYSADELQHMIHEQFRAYRTTLQDDRRHLLERFEIIDMARKVVGVGSVGTRAFIVLLQGRDQQDPLFLQIKEATASVLEDHLPKSRYKQHGERVVQGQRMMQAASDIYLGWTKGVEANRWLYWRQLRDMKFSVDVESLKAFGLDVPGPPMRMDARPCTCTIGGSDRDRRLSRQERCVRPVDHGLLRAIRGSERAGLSGVLRRGEVREIGSDRRCLRSPREAERDGPLVIGWRSEVSEPGAPGTSRAARPCWRLRRAPGSSIRSCPGSPTR